jgi:hypothetical protein
MIKSIYYSNFQFSLRYGIILLGWEGSESKTIFNLLKPSSNFTYHQVQH